MKENKYDDDAFFAEYSNMSRSVDGLAGAGEWHAFRKLMPDFSGKRVLDLGCGFGWHCAYALEHGAQSVVGVDLSHKMLSRAKGMVRSPKVQFIQTSIEDYPYPEEAFDVVVSSLALHYVSDFADICRKVYDTLAPGGEFVFSVEHPIFTAYGTQDWYRDGAGNILHWPVDGYFTEGLRHAVFLGQDVVKYHKTLTTYLSSLLKTGFSLTAVVEPEPDPTMLELPGMKDELRRPMMLLVSAKKPE